MKLSAGLLLCLNALILPGYAILTKGTIEIRGDSLAEPVTVSTAYDASFGDIRGARPPDPAQPLQVEIDLDEAQTTETNIYILNNDWAHKYPFFGASHKWRSGFEWDDNDPSQVSFVNVAQTLDATPVQGDTPFSELYPNELQEKPFYASAIWKYNPVTTELIPTYLKLDGTPLGEVHIYGHFGGWFPDQFEFMGWMPWRPQDRLYFYFVPDNSTTQTK